MKKARPGPPQTPAAHATLAAQMQAAMETRAVIEQAKGIIMGQRHCTGEDAFKILTKMSQDTNRKLHDVARDMVHLATEGPQQ